MCRNYGHPEKKSQFLCLKCLKLGIDGIQRESQRKKFHLKDLYCIYCQTETKHIEIRYCDYMEEIRNEAEKLHTKYYEDEEME